MAQQGRDWVSSGSHVSEGQVTGPAFLHPEECLLQTLAFCFLDTPGTCWMGRQRSWGRRGRSLRPACWPPCGVFLPPSPPRGQLPAGKLWPPRQGESQSPAFGCGAGGSRGSGRSLPESATDLSRPCTLPSGVLKQDRMARPWGHPGKRKGARRGCLLQVSGNSSASGLFGKKPVGQGLEGSSGSGGSMPRMLPGNGSPVPTAPRLAHPGRRGSHLLTGRAETGSRMPPAPGPGLRPDPQHSIRTETRHRGYKETRGVAGNSQIEATSGQATWLSPAFLLPKSSTEFST